MTPVPLGVIYGSGVLSRQILDSVAVRSLVDPLGSDGVDGLRDPVALCEVIVVLFRDVWREECPSRSPSPSIDCLVSVASKDSIGSSGIPFTNEF